MSAAQGIEFRAPLKTSAELQDVIGRVRSVCPSLEEDRQVDGDIAAMASLVSSGPLSDHAEYPTIGDALA